MIDVAKVSRFGVDDHKLFLILNIISVYLNLKYDQFVNSTNIFLLAASIQYTGRIISLFLDRLFGYLSFHARNLF